MNPRAYPRFTSRVDNRGRKRFMHTILTAHNFHLFKCVAKNLLFLYIRALQTF